MTRAMRRLAPVVLTAVTATLLALALLAGPALATEGQSDEPAASEDAGGFGSGQWDGLILAAIVGIVVGVGVFAMADPGSIPKADEHH